MPEPLVLTFDVWDTLIIDDSDEEIRAARGLLPKPAARRAAFREALWAEHPSLPAETIDAAYEIGEVAFRRWWKEEHHTPPVNARLDVALGHLGLPRPAGFDALVQQLQQMEVELPPRACEGVREALSTLAGRYRLGIISDAIVTPGTGIRQILAQHGLLEFFSVFVFSDEAGASKPSPKVFAAAATGFGLPVTQIVHIGDREVNDIAGPLAVGARALLYTGAIDRRGATPTQATAHFSHYADLPALVATLSGETP